MESHPCLRRSHSVRSLFLPCGATRLVPPFFIQGVGPTDLRQGILGSSVLLYFVSSIFLMAYYFRGKSDFLYWYSLCLAMLAIGLLAFFVQKSVGSPIGWLGRSANYVGGVFAIVAILRALRDAKTTGVRLEESIAGFFRAGAASYKGRFLEILPIPTFLILLVIIASLDSKTVFEPPGLFAALNTLFLSILPLGVVYFSTRGFLRSGLLTLFMLGSGALTLALGSLLSGWALALQGGGPNGAATIFNLACLVSAVFHLFGGASAFTGGHPKKDTRHKELIVAFTYIGIAFLMAILTLVTLDGIVPLFFVQGQGPTPLRQVVLGFTVILFGISGLLSLVIYMFSKTRMLYWYSLSLFLLAIGLVCYMNNSVIGGPIGWLGRFSLYLGGIYLLVAVVSASRDLRVRGESLEMGMASLFRNHLQSLVEERTLELAHANAELFKTNQRLQALMVALPVGVSFSHDASCRYITGNPCLFAQFDITPDDNISASAPDSTAPGRLVRFFHEGREIRDTELPLQRAVAENRVIPPKELEVHLPSGRRWFADASGAPILDEEGNVIGGVAVTVDITERKQNEQSLKESEKRVAANLKALTHMHALTTKISALTDYKAVLQEIMNTAVVIVEAERGTLQLIEDDSLNLVAHYGHEQPFIEFFSRVTSQASVCGEAMKRSKRVIVEDVEESPLFADTLSLGVLRTAGVRSVQSTPLVNRNGNLLGILTTQWSVPHTPDDHDLWRIDLLAQQATDSIENWRVEEALRKSHAELEVRVQERTADLEKAKQAIAVERQRLYDILETMPEMVCLLTPDHRYTFVNRSFREKFGDHNGRHCFDLVFGKRNLASFVKRTPC